MTTTDPLAGVPADELEAWFAEHVDTAPPLTRRQREAIASMLTPRPRVQPPGRAA